MIGELQKGQLGQRLQRIKSSVMDSETLDFPNGLFSHSFCSLVLTASANAEGICIEIYRTLQPGGVAVASTWSTYGYGSKVDKAMRAGRPSRQHGYLPHTLPAWMGHSGEVGTSIRERRFQGGGC